MTARHLIILLCLGLTACSRPHIKQSSDLPKNIKGYAYVQSQPPVMPPDSFLYSTYAKVLHELGKPISQKPALLKLPKETFYIGEELTFVQGTDKVTVTFIDEVAYRVSFSSPTPFASATIDDLSNKTSGNYTWKSIEGPFNIAHDASGITRIISRNPTNIIFQASEWKTLNYKPKPHAPNKRLPNPVVKPQK